MHILFDLDGTLTNPKEGFVNCIQFALSRLNIEIDASIDLESFIGPPLHTTFKNLCEDDSSAESAISLYRERYSSLGLVENRLYEGIPESLDQICHAASSVLVVTSKLTNISERIIEHFNLDRYFKAVYGSNLDGSLSDKTELIGHVLETEKILPQDAVMIGDRRYDMIGAKNHGIRALGVLWGFGSEEELLSSGADGLCAHPNELYEQLLT
jgi:phosphoglycolate phosphatase